MNNLYDGAPIFADRLIGNWFLSGSRIGPNDDEDIIVTSDEEAVEEDGEALAQTEEDGAPRFRENGIIGPTDDDEEADEDVWIDAGEDEE